MRRRIVLALLVSAVAATGAGCGAGRAAVRAGDDVVRMGKAARLGDDIARVARQSTVTTALKADVAFATTVGEVRVTAPPEQVQAVRDAAKALLWQAFCDVIEGQLTLSADSVASWISDNAFAFGLSLTGDAHVEFAGAVVAQATGLSEPPTACEELPDRL